MKIYGEKMKGDIVAKLLNVAKIRPIKREKDLQFINRLKKLVEMQINKVLGPRLFEKKINFQKQ